MSTRFTISDMVNGLLRILADRGYSSFVIRGDRIDAAFATAFSRLLQLAPKYDLDVRFRIAPDDFGESEILRSALNAAAQRDIVSFDNPEYQDMRLEAQKVKSTVRLERLPSTRELYEELADAFLAAYSQSNPGTASVA